MGRGKARRQLKRVAAPEELSPGEPDDASDEDSDLLKPAMETRSRPAVNISHLSGLGASAQGRGCFSTPDSRQQDEH